MHVRAHTHTHICTYIQQNQNFKGSLGTLVLFCFHRWIAVKHTKNIQKGREYNLTYCRNKGLKKQINMLIEQKIKIAQVTLKWFYFMIDDTFIYISDEHIIQLGNRRYEQEITFSKK